MQQFVSTEYLTNTYGGSSPVEFFKKKFNSIFDSTAENMTVADASTTGNSLQKMCFPKKTLIVIIVLLIISSLALAVYLYFYKGTNYESMAPVNRTKKQNKRNKKQRRGRQMTN